MSILHFSPISNISVVVYSSLNKDFTKNYDFKVKLLEFSFYSMSLLQMHVFN